MQERVPLSIAALHVETAEITATAAGAGKAEVDVVKAGVDCGEKIGKSRCSSTEAAVVAAGTRTGTAAARTAARTRSVRGTLRLGQTRPKPKAKGNPEMAIPDAICRTLLGSDLAENSSPIVYAVIRER